MREESRCWFDFVYGYSEGVLPFGAFTGKCTKEDITRFTRDVLNEKEVESIFRITRELHNKKPSDSDFLEEKVRLLPMIKRELVTIFSDVKTAIYFGSLIGDLDIALFSQLSPDTVEERLKSNLAIIRKYPIVDWEGLIFFASASLEQFAYHVQRSRQIVTGQQVLSLDETLYVKETLLSAELLWGDPGIVDKIKMISNDI